MPEKVEIAVIDVSFISLEKIIPSAVEILVPGGDIVALGKPQFEARREEVGKGGIIKQPGVHAVVLGRFIAWVVKQGLRLNGLVASPVLGASGNTEFLVWLKQP